MTQSQIDSALAKIKAWYVENYPLCVFCGHRVRRGDLAHLIRRSSSRDLQTHLLNTGLAHRDCHDLFDNDPEQAQYLPRIVEVMYIIYLLDIEYFYQLAGKMPELSPAFELFPMIPDMGILHHGELVTLHYLYTSI